MRYRFQQLYCASSKAVGEYRDQTVLDMIADSHCLLEWSSMLPQGNEDDIVPMSPLKARGAEVTTSLAST